MSNIKRWAAISVSIMAMFVLGILTAEAGTIHVDDDACPGTGSGTVADPYCKIQDAIDDAISNVDEVLVHDGTYVENINFNKKAITVKSEHGAAFTTIDGNQSGSVITFNSGENSGSVIEGFTITNGSGITNTWGGTNGGGIYCFSSSPTILKCTISGNSATGDDSSGGGISCVESSPSLTDCTINNNTAGAAGGGIFCYNQSSPTITNCTISNNSAENGGGIFCASSSSPAITKCIISGNSAEGDDEIGNGGGIHCQSSSPTITNCTLIENSAKEGGGIFCGSLSSPDIIDCTINNNTADAAGGGIFCYLHSSPSIVNCTISGNSANMGSGGGIGSHDSSPLIKKSIISGNSADEGGGIHCSSSSATITNCIISGNRANESGGIQLGGYSFPLIANCTITGNTGIWKGGGIECGSSSPTVVNSILWGNIGGIANEIYLSSISSISISYSDIKEGDPDNPGFPYPGVGNIDADPRFVDPRPASEAPTTEGNYHLKSDSPCIDVGTSDTTTYSNLPTDDIDGDIRPQGTSHDMGSDEYPSGVFCIDSDNDGYFSQAGCNTEIDCDDTDSHTYPGANEKYDGKDNDCDGKIDEDCSLFGDVNCDGSVTPADALCIFQKYLGLSSCLD